MRKKTNTSFAGNALLLCLGGILCKIIGALYKIPLTNVLGTQGIGIYQTVFPVFSIVLTLSSGGISQSVSALLSSNTVDKERSVVRSAFLSVTVGVTGLSLILYFLSPVLSKLQGVSGIKDCYTALIPAVVFSGYSCVLRGYYQAKRKVSPTVVSQITEQAVKLFLGIALSVQLARYGVLYAVTGALIGVSLSEFFAFLYLFIKYMLDKDRDKTKSVIPFSFSFLRVLRYAVPLSIGGLITPISNLLDSVSVVNVLSNSMSLANATSLYGLLSGTVATIINLPAVFTVALGVAVLPDLKKDRDSSTLTALKIKARTCVKLTLFICIPVSVFMLSSSTEIVDFLYPSFNQFERTACINLLSLSTLSITFIGLTQIYSSMLFGIGLYGVSLKNLFISIGFKALFIYPALLFFGIYGVCVLNILSYILSCGLNLRAFHRAVGEKFLLRDLITVTVTSVPLAFVLFLIIPRLNLLWIFALLCLFVVLYCYITLPRVFSTAELNSLPLVKTLWKKGEKDAYHSRSWKRRKPNNSASGRDDIESQ